MATVHTALMYHVGVSVSRFPDSVEDAFRRTTPRFLQFSCHGGVNLAIGKGLELAPDATAEFTPSEVSDVRRVGVLLWCF